MTDELPVGVTLELAVQVVGCPSCRAPAGVPCKTPRGRLAPVHAPRYELAKQHVRDRAKLDKWNRAVKGGS